MNSKQAIHMVSALWLILFFLAAESASGEVRGPLGESQIKALGEQAPDEHEMPDAEALVLFDGTYVTYEDGLASVRRQRLRRAICIRPRCASARQEAL